MAADIKANVGTILVGTHTLAYCSGIEIDYDEAAIKYHAGDYKYPIYVAAGNSEMTITVDCAEYNADETYSLETIRQDGDPVTVVLGTGDRGGGIPAATFTNCVVVQHTITSAQGDVIKARVILSKMADAS